MFVRSTTMQSYTFLLQKEEEEEEEEVVVVVVVVSIRQFKVLVL